MNSPLKNKLFISTRPKGQSDELGRLFTEAGATMIEMPLIEIKPVDLSDEDKKTVTNLDTYHWLIFTSQNGVKYFFEHIESEENPEKIPESVKIAVIGSKTEKVLNQFGYAVDFLNPGSTGEEFAVAFSQKIKVESGKQKILLILGNLARTVIEDKLNEFADCTRINIYETVNPETVDKEALEIIRNNKYEMIIFTSPSGIHNFIKISGDIHNKNIRAACIGETTASAAKESGFNLQVVAQNASAQGIIEPIINFYTHELKKTE